MHYLNVKPQIFVYFYVQTRIGKPDPQFAHGKYYENKQKTFHNNGSACVQLCHAHFQWLL